MKHALVVGAGFAGATTARTLADAGWQVTVVDARDHIGGNAYDYMNEHGIRVHKYGPHLWHTNNDAVQEWTSQFTEWVPYRHNVAAQLPNGKHVPLPINNETIETVFEERLYDWAKANNFVYYDQDDEIQLLSGAHKAFLNTLQVEHENITNSRQHVEASVGKELCELFFAPYTRKMWGLELQDLPATVAGRIPTSVGTWKTEYFPNDKHQYLPKDGYTEMFKNILNHPNIKVLLKCTREEITNPANAQKWLDAGQNVHFDMTFTSEPIDTYYGCDLGELPWRSIYMHTITVPLPQALPTPVVNFTHDGPYTRVTEWKQLPKHGKNAYLTTLTFEEPLDYRDNNMERYYPVKTSQEVCPNRELYKKYKGRAEQNPKLQFIGRCGMYVYSDMHQVIATTLAIVNKFLEKQNSTD